MVYDWFQRRSLDAPESQEAEPEAAGELGPSESSPPESTAGEGSGGSAVLPDGSAGAGEELAVVGSPAPAPAEVAPSGIDQEALDWARQAYARLKAQQEAARQTATAGASPSPGPAPLPEPNPAPEPPAQSPAASEPPAVADAPAPAQAPSLLEQAAARRRERLEALSSPDGGAAGASAPGLEAPPADDSGSPAVPTEGPASDDGAPRLGAFDQDFTWSAEVLAAQGRSPEQISLEEIDWLGRLRRGLEKTRRGLVTQLLENLGDDPLTPEVLDDLETTLLQADVGVLATDRVLEALRRRLNEEVVDPAEGLRFLKEQLRDLLEQPIRSSGHGLLVPERGRLNVWLLVGVNGVGKTTTLGKLAHLAVRSGYSCLIAAADTFRAAAIQQVQIWGQRSNVPVVANPSANADPAAVVFDAIGAARAQDVELVLVDTAGRLQTKHNLMEELAKVRRIVDKLAPEAVVESLLVLDASQGQNGLRQAMAFASAAGLTGVVITKLDGSAKGGVALAVASEAGLPIRFIGAGEGIRDLRPFNSYEFVEALLSA